MMRTSRALAGIALLAALAHTDAAAQGGKTTKLAAVPLSVDIEHSSDTVTRRIVGDGAPYEDGAADGTRASIDQHGNLIVSFGRPVWFDYSAPVSPDAGAGPVSGWYDDSYISTLNAGGMPLQSLPPGSSQCVKLNWQFPTTGGWWRHGFNRGIDGSVQDDTSYAVVTKEQSGEVWLVEPVAGTCGTYRNPEAFAKVFTQVSTKGKWVFTDYGTFSLPFKLRLRQR